MENPGQLLRRARQAQQQKGAPRPAFREEEVPEEPRQFVPRHASYSALMRSHDRMGTRHIQDKR